MGKETERKLWGDGKGTMECDAYSLETSKVATMGDWKKRLVNAIQVGLEILPPSRPEVVVILSGGWKEGGVETYSASTGRTLGKIHGIDAKMKYCGCVALGSGMSAKLVAEIICNFILLMAGPTLPTLVLE